MTCLIVAYCLLPTCCRQGLIQGLHNSDMTAAMGMRMKLNMGDKAPSCDLLRDLLFLRDRSLCNAHAKLCKAS